MTSAECAESTSLYADVCEIDVPVHYVRDYVAYCSASKFVCYQNQGVHFNAITVEEFDCVFNRWILAVQ
jgi:hypothetical protein